LTPAQKEVLKVWIAAGLWLAVIAIESTAWLSAENTSRFLYPIFHFLFGLSRAEFRIWHIVIRKLGHFVGYFILSVLLYRAWRLTLPLQGLVRWAKRWATAAFLMTALVASLDEFHQSFIPTRTARVTDVLLDSFAALVAQTVIFWLSNRYRARMSAAAD
jgi:VanZ family protein